VAGGFATIALIVGWLLAAAIPAYIALRFAEYVGRRNAIRRRLEEIPYGDVPNIVPHFSGRSNP